MSLLVRTPPDQYRVAAGDILSIYVPGVLGQGTVDFNDGVGIQPPINSPYTPGDPPTIGFPIPVRDNGTISLPQIPPLNVDGMTLREVELALKEAYTVDRQVLRPAEAMVLVSLQRPREHRVLVVRQETSTGLDTPTGSQPGSLNIGATKKGTARIVRLRAYENDVLHALAQAEGADGLPGLDAENTIYIIRRRDRSPGHEPWTSPPDPPGAPHRAPPLVPPDPDESAYRPTGPLGSQRLYGAGRYRPQGLMLVSGHSLATAVSPAGGHPSRANVLDHQDLPAPATPSLYAPSGGQFPPQLDVPPGAHFDYGGPIRHSPQLEVGALPASPGEMSPESDPMWNEALAGLVPTIDSPDVIKIPVRLGDGEMPHITEEDITLGDGDIVFIESRETEVFYTGGLLGGGQYTLPRDYDLRVLEALSIAESRNVSGSGGGEVLRSIGGVSALNQDVATSASRVVILRYLPNGQRVAIEVDINKAMRYQEENIVVQPGDMLILQYTFPEAVAALTQRFLLEGALIGIATSMFTTGGR